MNCKKCGKEITNQSGACPQCGAPAGMPAAPGAKSKIAAGLLGIFLGGLGVHRFYLGFTKIGIIQIIVTIVTFGMGSIWGFIEGILYLTGSLNVDAEGRALRD